MKSFNIEFSEEEIHQLQELIADFQSYYRDEDDEDYIWDFQDVDNQRAIGLDIIAILSEKLPKTIE